MPTILIADDDQKIIELLRRTLGYEGYGVLTAIDGREAINQAQAFHPDLVVLDWMMPGLDGVEVARRLRAAEGMPILMLTTRDTVEDSVRGLDSGADDYLLKPFAPAELLVRVRSLLRRKEENGEKPLHYSDLVIDPTTRDTHRSERTIALSPKEYDLLSYFLQHPRQVLPRDRILEEVWGYDFGGEDNVPDVYIGYLRVKLEAAAEPRLIQTVRGVGYVLREA